MLKPLLPSIPSKELLIEGKFYNVYEQVRLNISPKGDARAYFSLNRRLVIKHIKTFPKITDIAEKDKAIHLYIEDILAQFHDHIEKHYVGDSYVRTESMKPPHTRKHIQRGLTYIKMSYAYRMDPANIVGNITSVKKDAYIGKDGELSDRDIAAKIAEAEEHQRETLERFKNHLAAKRKAFREQVDKEIQERNHQLQLQEI